MVLHEEKRKTKRKRSEELKNPEGWEYPPATPKEYRLVRFLKQNSKNQMLKTKSNINQLKTLK